MACRWSLVGATLERVIQNFVLFTLNSIQAPLISSIYDPDTLKVVLKETGSGCYDDGYQQDYLATRNLVMQCGLCELLGAG